MLAALESDVRWFHWDTFWIMLLIKTITTLNDMTVVEGSILFQYKSRRATRGSSKIIDSFWVLRIKHNDWWFISCVKWTLAVVRLVHSFVGRDLHLSLRHIDDSSKDLRLYSRECVLSIFEECFFDCYFRSWDYTIFNLMSGLLKSICHLLISIYAQRWY